MKFLIKIIMITFILVLSAVCPDGFCGQGDKEGSSRKTVYLQGTVKGIDLKKSVINVDGWIIWVNEDTEFEGIESLKELKFYTIYVLYYRTDERKNIALRISMTPIKGEPGPD